MSITAPLISADPTVNVGETDGSVVLTVELDRASSGTVTVDYFTISGNAQENQDYAATAGTLTFAAGDTSRTITVPIIDDAGYDRHRLLFFVALSNASGATLPAPNYPQVVIQNDEPKPTATIEDVAVNEADGRMTLTLRLSHTSSDAIRYLTPANGSLVSGTATTAVDYDDFLQRSDAVITMPVRALSATFDIAIVDDTEEEGDETIGIVWRKHPDDFAVPASLAFTGTIKDKDTNGPNPNPNPNPSPSPSPSSRPMVAASIDSRASAVPAGHQRSEEGRLDHRDRQRADALTCPSRAGDALQGHGGALGQPDDPALGRPRCGGRACLSTTRSHVDVRTITESSRVRALVRAASWMAS